MRKVYLLPKLLIAVGIISTTTFDLFSQTENSERTCGTVEYMDEQKALHPEIETNIQQIEQFTQNWIVTKGNEKGKTNSVITIPVVVHVVYNTSTQNISDAQIQSQIDILNADFRKLNSDYSSVVPSDFQGVAADFGIEFCLATLDPNGDSTNGITRTPTASKSFSSNNNVKYTSKGGHDAWDASKYLNIWVCKLSLGLLGYAQFPGGVAATDGVVITYTAFGNQGTAKAPFNLGRSATHEIGHWLNLYHIWGDDNGSCVGTDKVGDTPNQSNSSYGCPVYPKTDKCTATSPGIMFMNFMDYSDDACMAMFSQGQSDRANALFASGGARESLLTSNGCGTITVGVDTDTVVVVNPSPVYCTSNGANSLAYISKVELNTLSNTSSSDGGYGDYTALSTSLNISSAYTLTLSPGYASTVANVYWRAWIDWNQDGDFDDVDELVYAPSGTSKVIVSGTFSVPASALTGNTRMRVSMKAGTAAPTSCEAFKYGEVEDYTIVVRSYDPSGGSLRITDNYSYEIYPNPAKNTLSYNGYSNMGEDRVMVLLTNITGKIVYSEQAVFSNGFVSGTIDISNLTQGIYHLLIQSELYTEYKKVVIIK